MAGALVRLGVSLVLTLALLGALVWLAPGRAVPLEGAQMVTRALLCDDPLPQAPCEGREVSLPYFGGETRAEGDVERLQVRLDAPLQQDAGPLALFFPGFASGLSVRIGDVTVLRTAKANEPQWHWNRPAHVSVPAHLLDARAPIDLVLRSGPWFEAELLPFHVGPDAVLREAFLWRTTLTRDAARFGLVLAVLCTIAMATLAVIRRDDRVYHWAALAAGSASVLSLHYASIRPPLPETLWQAVWTASVPILIAALHRFIRRFLRRAQDGFETATLSFALASAVALLLAAAFLPGLLMPISAVIHAAAMLTTIYLMAIFLRDRHFTTPGRFYILYLAIGSVAWACTMRSITTRAPRRSRCNWVSSRRWSSWWSPAGSS